MYCLLDYTLFLHIRNMGCMYHFFVSILTHEILMNQIVNAKGINFANMMTIRSSMQLKTTAMEKE